jgi:ATP-dependent Lhr-like helicase
MTHAAEDWFASRGWTPFAFQCEAWSAYTSGESGLLHAPTGTGKTYAVWFGPLMEWLDGSQGGAADMPRREKKLPLRVLWITPLRALANDTVEALRAPLDDLGIPWTVELRTGDTTSSVKQRQRRTPPTALVTTPESLSVLLSYDGAREMFAHLRCVIVDEWHELMSTKRGVQTELGLAALRAFAPKLRIWGLSATMGNMAEAAATLLGPDPGHAPRLIHADLHKEVCIDTLRPDEIERFPWSGHLGTKLLPRVLERIHNATSTLLFTNTRSQAEIWFRSLLRADPSLVGAFALHHGSLDRGVRVEVEKLLRNGRLRAVVCTSSLDLGVDFPPVDQIVQIGSPKGIARLLQRAGRSGHQPDAVSRVIGVPTNALELIEFDAARDALAARRIEPRRPLDRPLDVLVQHVVTRALGGGFVADDLLAEIRSTSAYARLDGREWRWVLDFAVRGGDALRAYPHYRRVVERDGRFIVESRQIARRHRLSIGTITSDASMLVKFVSGRTIGSIEETFISRLAPGDRFVFAGRTLELIRVREMTAQVKLAKHRRGRVPRWAGGRSPLSTHLAAAVRAKLGEVLNGSFDTPELASVRPLLELQAAMSIIPGPDQLLIERTKSRDGHHVFLFPLEGRLVHEGLAALLAYRITRTRPTSINITPTDWGIELLSRHPLPAERETWRGLLSPDDLLDDLLACLNSTALARRHFREIARVAGLIMPGFPGQQKSARQLQASSDLLFDVFAEFDPSNMLLDQAKREVLDRELEVRRLRNALESTGGRDLIVVETKRLTPLAFPIWAERLRSQYVSSERWNDRVREMLAKLERDAPETTMQVMGDAVD